MKYKDLEWKNLMAHYATWNDNHLLELGFRFWSCLIATKEVGGKAMMWYCATSG